jgi:hypothetical protein
VENSSKPTLTLRSTYFFILFGLNEGVAWWQKLSLYSHTHTMTSMSILFHGNAVNWLLAAFSAFFVRLLLQVNV